MQFWIGVKQIKYVVSERFFGTFRVNIMLQQNLIWSALHFSKTIANYSRSTHVYKPIVISRIEGFFFS